MIPIQIRVTKKLIEMMDELIDNGIYSNRSEVIRDAVRRHVRGYLRDAKKLRNNKK
jgi:Arc/MetJ-type ribon-helix-helix transcriptional regulator